MMLFTQHRNRLWALAYSVTRDYHLAEDTLQETSIAILNASEKFDNSRPFLPWALGITRNQSLKTVRKHAKHAKSMSSETLTILQDKLINYVEDGEERFNSLRDCLSELSSENRRVMTMKYFEKKSADEIAREIKRSETATFSLLQRLRFTLAKCVKSKMGRLAHE